jgi:hypothetical protein
MGIFKALGWLQKVAKTTRESIYFKKLFFYKSETTTLEKCGNPRKTRL